LNPTICPGFWLSKIFSSREVIGEAQGLRGDQRHQNCDKPAGFRQSPIREYGPYLQDPISIVCSSPLISN
jgi:hypothetical protein